MSKAEIAVNTLKNTRLDKLIELWEETEKQAITTELAMVRGWLMQALEFKNQVAFDRYIDNCHIDNNIRNYF